MSLSFRKTEFAALFLWFPWCVIACVALWSAWFPASAQSIGVWALLGSALFFGLPHGACDLWAIAHAARRTPNAASSTRFDFRDARLWRWMAAYLVAVALTLALWRFASSWALLLFLALSAWHFGSADTWLQKSENRNANQNSDAARFNTQRADSPDENRLNRRGRLAFLALSCGRGLIVINAPLALQPRATQELLVAFARLSDASADLSLLWRAATWLLVSGLFLQLIGSALMRFDNHATSSTRKSSRAGGIAALWIETLWILLLFAVAPPLLGVACYFIGVHSWRHVLRLELFADATDSAAKVADETRSSLGFAWRAVVHQHRHGVALALLSLLGVAPILLWWPQLLHGAGRWNVAYLVLISAVTVPHATVIAWLEARHDL